MPSRTRGAVEAFGLPLEGARLLLRERSLQRLALVPFLLSGLAVAGAVTFVVAFSGELYSLAAGWLPVLTADRWFEWLWVGPVRLVLLVVGWALFGALAVACVAAAFLVASLTAAPFHDALSRRVEAVLTGQVAANSEEGWRAVLRDASRSILEELRRLVFFLAIQTAILASAFVIPLLAPLAVPAMVLVTMLFLPLDYASYVLDRRGLLRFRDKRRWVFAHTPAMLGYGAAAFLTCLVPGLNFVAMPVLVVAGTLLALEYSPPEVKGAS